MDCTTLGILGWGRKCFYRSPGDRREVFPPGRVGVQENRGFWPWKRLSSPLSGVGSLMIFWICRGKTEVRKSPGSPFPWQIPGTLLPFFISHALLAANGQNNHVLFSELFLGLPFHHTHLD